MRTTSEHQGDEDYLRIIETALGIIEDCGQEPGERGKAWVIDQIRQALLDEINYPENYETWIARYCLNENNLNDPYEWDVGTEPIWDEET